MCREQMKKRDIVYIVVVQTEKLKWITMRCQIVFIWDVCMHCLISGI